jgi:hypothetical protein
MGNPFATKILHVPPEPEVVDLLKWLCRAGSHERLSQTALGVSVVWPISVAYNGDQCVGYCMPKLADDPIALDPAEPGTLDSAMAVLVYNDTCAALRLSLRLLDVMEGSRGRGLDLHDAATPKNIHWDPHHLDQILIFDVDSLRRRGSRNRIHSRPVDHDYMSSRFPGGDYAILVMVCQLLMGGVHPFGLPLRGATNDPLAGKSQRLNSGQWWLEDPDQFVLFDGAREVLQMIPQALLDSLVAALRYGPDHGRFLREEVQGFLNGMSTCPDCSSGRFEDACLTCWALGRASLRPSEAVSDIGGSPGGTVSGNQGAVSAPRDQFDWSKAGTSLAKWWGDEGEDLAIFGGFILACLVGLVVVYVIGSLLWTTIF